MWKHLAGAVSAALLATGTAAAQDAGELFSKLDANKDGYITPDEVQESQKALYERLLRNADKDGDKRLSKEEFQAGLKPDETPRQPLAGGQPFGGGPQAAAGELRAFFDRLDRDKDGKLSKEELPVPLQASFDRLDANSDGSVSFEEYSNGRQFGKRPGAAQPDPKENFRQLDRDGDGKLTKDEAGLGFPWNWVDVNGDGVLTQEEYLWRVARQPPAGSIETPSEASARWATELFAYSDANKDGRVTTDEAQGKIGNFARILQALNPGGDFVAKEQFIRYFTPPSGSSSPAGRPGAAMLADRGQLEALFDRTDSNSDGKLTKDEIPEERPGMRAVLERSGGDSLAKEQFVRGMMALAQQAGGQPPRPEAAPPRRPDGPPGAPPVGGLPGGLFAALDTDKDGQLSTAEIVAAGTTLMKFDRNGDGKLTPEEIFGPGAGPPPARPADGAPPSARPGEPRPGVGRPGGGFSLEAFDKDKDGKISKEEAPDRLKERFEQVDSNSDGFIDQAEFRQMTERMQKAGGKAKGKRPDSNNN
jgi:Ca2+-binding EF-hand superfamily protein